MNHLKKDPVADDLRSATHALHGGPNLSHLAGKERPKRAPLSFNQLAYWQLRGASGYRPIRQVVSVTRLTGDLHENAMKEALAAVTERHDGLRTNIVNRNGEIMQEVAEQSNRDLLITDLTHVPLYELDTEIQRQIVSAVVDVRDYSRDPLFKPVLLRLGKTESILILAIEHMVSDGASMNILETEIFTAYEQLDQGYNVSLPRVQMQCADYAIWQRTTLAEYFRGPAAAWPAWRRTEFPAGSRDRVGRGLGLVRFTLDMKARRTAEEWARRRGTTLVMLVLATYVALVTHWCDVSDTVIQVMFNGRTNRLIENTVGYIAYPLYLHISVDRNATFMNLLEAVTTEYCQACERPDFFRLYTLSPRPEFTQNTTFNWVPRNRGRDEESMPAKASHSRSRVEYEPVLDDTYMDAEPGIGFVDAGGEIDGLVAFPENQFASSTMTRFAEAFKHFLDTIILFPAIRVRDIAMT